MEFPSEKIPKEAEIKPGLEEKPGTASIEVRPEAVIEKKEVAGEAVSEMPKARPKVSIFKKKRGEEVIHLTKSETLKRIEEILVEGLDSYYQNLPETLKAQFKKKGEETASRIEKIIGSAKIVIGKIFNLIVAWLKIIPGVNKFFIEQEAKIKTDRILAMAEKKKRGRLS